MVRHDIDDDFHAVLVRARDQRLEFREPIRGIDSKVRIDVVVVLHGVRRAGTTFDDVRIVVADAIVGVVANDGMMRHAGIPDVRYAQFANTGKRLVRKVIELADAVFLDRSPGFVSRNLVAEQARKHLVYDRFARRGFLRGVDRLGRRLRGMLGAARHNRE